MKTKHTSTRMQQRGIEPIVLELLDRYGSEFHLGDGAVRRYFDKAARRRLERAMGRRFARRMRDQLDAAMIEKDGRVITIYWRH